MKVSRWAALAAALVLAAAIAPAAVVHGQSSRVLQVFGGVQIGVTIDDLEAEDARQGRTGVRVTAVSPDGPADKAGIKAGDSIVEFDGERVRSARQFARLVQESTPDRSVAAVLSRDGSKVTVNVTPAGSSWNDDVRFRLLDRPGAMTPMPAPPRPPSVTPRAFPDDFVTILRPGTRRLGVTIESLDDQLAEYFGVKEGVLVKSVSRDSVAQKVGIKAGDVIAAIDGRKIYETSDVNRAMERVAESGDFTVEIVRDRKTQTLKGKLEARDTRTRARGVRTVL
jgi:serine protease Do